MKKLVSIFILALFANIAFAQEEPADSTKKDDDKSINISLSVGKKRVKTRFLLLDLGINSYHYEGKVNIPASVEAFELRHARSIEVNLHIYRQRIKIGSGIFNIEHGLSFDFNNYGFQNKVDYRIDSLSGFYIDANSNIEKSRLALSRMTIPFMLHFETYPRKLKKSLHVGIGAYASIRLGSGLRIKDVNARKASTIKNDFGLNDFTFGTRMELGFGPVNLYATYSLTDLFKTGQGPSLTPFSVGFSVIPF